MTTKKPNDDAPSVLDALADDAQLVIAKVPDEYPPGTPDLIPYTQLRPRSRRAAFKRKYAAFAASQGDINDMNARVKGLDKDVAPTPEVNALRMKLWADADDMYQLMDEALEAAAKDPDMYREWSDAMDDDNQLAVVFTVYQKRSQPGEASSSAT